MNNSERRITASATMVLDFDPHCVCGVVATHFLELHALDYCTVERTVAAFRCDFCLERDMARVEDIVDDCTGFCATCGLTMRDIGDMVVQLSPLTAGRFS